LLDPLRDRRVRRRLGSGLRLGILLRAGLHRTSHSAVDRRSAGGSGRRAFRVDVVGVVVRLDRRLLAAAFVDLATFEHR
jgi:hypothetical protein